MARPVEHVAGTMMQTAMAGTGTLDVDAAAMQKFGGAFRVESIPPELRIIQRGHRMGHFEIVPRQAMTPERFQELANQVKLAPVGG
jgi:hypothetical protein